MDNLYCYLNGKILKLKDTKISPLDLGFSRGYAITEVLRADNSKIFLFDEHYKRLMKAVKSLRLNLKESKTEIKKIMETLMKKNKVKDAKLRLVLSAGIGKTDLDLGSDQTLFVLAEKAPVYPKEYYTKGIKLISVNFKRNLNDVKSVDYIEAIRNRKLMFAKGAHEILYIANNKVLECSTSNIFMFKKGILVTPDNGVLFGVTRGLVLKVAKKAFKIEMREIGFEELLKADEVFITATSKEIIPIVKIDSNIITKGKVGENTKKMMELFKVEKEKILKS